MGVTQDDPKFPHSEGDFATTQWSLVIRAGVRQSQEAEKALATSCERYWFPLYAYVRRHARDVNEAQDLTQEFFARLLEKETLAAAVPELGRFRAFLLSAMKNFMTNEWDRANAQKRGGGRKRLSLDLAIGEGRLDLQPAHDLTPERLYERKWTLTLLELVMERLQSEFVAANQGRQFESLKATLAGDRQALSFATVAAELGISEEAARQAGNRLRKRYRELLRREVAQTVADPGEVDEEIRSLLKTLEP